MTSFGRVGQGGKGSCSGADLESLRWHRIIIRRPMPMRMASDPARSSSTTLYRSASTSSNRATFAAESPPHEITYRDTCGVRRKSEKGPSSKSRRAKIAIQRLGSWRDQLEWRSSGARGRLIQTCRWLPRASRFARRLAEVYRRERRGLSGAGGYFVKYEECAMSIELSSHILRNIRSAPDNSALLSATYSLRPARLSPSSRSNISPVAAASSGVWIRRRFSGFMVVSTSFRAGSRRDLLERWMRIFLPSSF